MILKASKLNLQKGFIILLALCFILKLILGFKLSHSFIHRGNSHTYLNSIAFNLKDNGEYAIKQGVPSVDYEPLYPYLMSIAYKISGANWLGLTIIQALLYAITSWLIFKIGEMIWSITAGFVAGLYHSVYPYLFSYALSIYDTTLFITIIVALLYYTLKSKKNIYDFILIGVLFGLGILSRATIIVFVPGVFVFLIYQQKERRKQLIMRMSVMIIVAAVVVSPWIIRNYLYTGKILISTHGSFGIWEGNNELTYNYLVKDISLDEIYRRKPPPAIYQKFPLKARPPRESVAAAAAYTIESTNWIKSNFCEFLKLAVIKAEKLWSWNRNPSSSSLEYGSNEGRQSVYLVSYLPLLVLCTFGMYFLIGKSKPVAVLFLIIFICFTGAHMIAMGFTRARLPIDPMLMLLAGFAVAHIKEKYIENKEN